MKAVHKKSIDPAVNQVLVAAYRSQTPLIWDRAEALQPQCGFGRLAICCSDCQEGPCRTNPFAQETQHTICGQDNQALLTGKFLKKAADGAVALTQLAGQSGSGFGAEAIRQLVVTDDEMPVFTDGPGRLQTIGRCTNAALAELGRYQRETGGAWQPAVVGVNLGVLPADTVNIVFHGHVDRQVVAQFKAAAQAENIAVTLAGMCGNEFSGSLQLPVVTNYDSQEAPLLTGRVDLLVLGRQCVLPSLRQLAGQQGIAVLQATPAIDYQAAVHAARQASRRRPRAATAPSAVTEAWIGYTADNSAALLARVAEQYEQGQLQGIVYLGGCGLVANTQDEQPVKLAAALVAAGYLVVTAGCAGTALAKAGLCRPDWRHGDYPLQAVLPASVPPVLHLGSCHDAGELLGLAAVLPPRLPLAAVFPEINHNKVLATAVGFAAAGIPAWLGYDAIPGNAALPGSNIRPLPAVPELLQALAAAAGK
ncbi:hypothetical protein [Sporomusa termitida]|uniref:Carbon-monoxide dehydrogenase, catalytic subunit n=1 Tax=Sporomusa termitida TaxID=2377 RepID=A0A517DNJ6_9FIRM|nr:hypothetical protein [Sporomusa termitida]QDR78912.1 carbon-monoxide dehydrogenase, catalytic subunit [Sporomusa termitida]